MVRRPPREREIRRSLPVFPQPSYASDLALSQRGKFHCVTLLVSSSLVCRFPFVARYHGGRRPPSDDSLHSPTVIPPSALDKSSIMKRHHRRRTYGHTSTRRSPTMVTLRDTVRRSPTMVTLHDTRFVERRWWNDGWTVKTVVTWRSSASMIPAPDYTNE